jgi:MFS family permease
MMFLTSPGQTYFIALFSGEVRTELSLTHGEFGAVYSLATLLSAFVLLKTGALIDRIELRTFAIACLVVLASASVLFALSNTVWMLFLAIFLLRQTGQGLMSMTASTAMMRYAQSAKAKANSLSNMGYSVAEATLPSLVILLLAVVGWRESWLILSALLAFVMPLAIVLLLHGQVTRHADYQHRIDSDNAPASKASGIRHWTRAEVLRDPYFYLLTPALLSQSLLYTGFMFHQIHLVETKGWSLALWGSLYALFSATTIVTSLLVGVWSDRVGAVKLAPFVTLPMAIGLAALSTSNSVVAAVIFMVAMGLSSGAQGALGAPFYSERYGTRHFGSIKSLASFAMVIMSAMSPVILGWLIDRGVAMNQLLLGGSIYAALIITMALIATHRMRVALKGQPQ